VTAEAPVGEYLERMAFGLGAAPAVAVRTGAFVLLARGVEVCTGEVCTGEVCMGAIPDGEGSGRTPERVECA
jgi:hypothetical protein